MLSEILSAVANNFGVLYPSMYTQLGFTGSPPPVPFFFGPKYLPQQSAPNQVVCVVGDEPIVGSEVHSTQPSSAPRELMRRWTRVNFYCWGAPSVLPNWTPGATIAAGSDIGPSTGAQNGLWFQGTAGTTGLTEPAWPSTIGGTVSDNGITWTAIGSVDSFRVFDTDMTDLIRITVAAACHYTAVGSFKPVKGSWYDRTDQFVMSGLTNRISFDFLIPVPDVAPVMAQINKAAVTGSVTLP